MMHISAGAPSPNNDDNVNGSYVGGVAPTNSNSTLYDELTTTYDADSGQAGNMFDVVALKDVIIHEMDVHIVENPTSKISVYTRDGTFEGHEQDSEMWTKRASVIVQGRGVNMATPLPAGALDLVEIMAGTTCAFYITLDVPEIRYSSGSGTAGNLFAFNDDLQILEGVGNAYPAFGATFFNRVWNGSLRYTKTESHLATTFGGGSGQAGVMFDVQALQNIILQSFDLHIASEEEQLLKIYTKEGTFVGSESSNADWQLMSDDITVLGMGEGLKSSIPSNAFIPISITTGTRRAFYITVQNTVLVYSGGTQLGNRNVYAENVDLKIMEGSGNAYLFGAHFTPRVFNGVIRYTKPHMRHISTEFESNSGQAGIMFDVIAKRDMAMHGIEVNIVSSNADADADAIEDIAVWYREGSHVGYEHDSRDWTQLCHVSVSIPLISEDEQLIALPPNSFAPVSITSGTQFAFYVTSSEPILRYAMGDGENSSSTDVEETVANSDLVIFDGTGVEYPFGKAFRPRKWNGVLRYTVANIPSNVVNREMVTTFLGGSGQSGIMFDVVAKRDVSIYSLDLHIVSPSSDEKEVFQIFSLVDGGSHVGHEKDADAWQLLGSANVRPQHRRTPLPLNCFEPIVIEKGDTKGLYVTLTSNHMRYSGGNKVGNVYLANDDIMVLEGTGITFPFGEIYRPRVFNGAIRYTVLDDE